MIAHSFKTSEATYNRLYHLINERRGNTKALTIPVEDLWSLLQDHAEMSKKVTEESNAPRQA